MQENQCRRRRRQRNCDPRAQESTRRCGAHERALRLQSRRVRVRSVAHARSAPSAAHERPKARELPTLARKPQSSMNTCAPPARRPRAPRTTANGSSEPPPARARCLRTGSPPTSITSARPRRSPENDRWCIHMRAGTHDSLPLRAEPATVNERGARRPDLANKTRAGGAKHGDPAICWISGGRSRVGTRVQCTAWLARRRRTLEEPARKMR